MDFTAAFEAIYGDEGRLTFDELFHDPEAVYSNWQRHASGRFWRLDRFDPVASGTDGLGGVYLIGFGKQKLYALQAGAAADVGAVVGRLKDDPTIRSFGRYGPVRVTWMTAPEEVRPGILRFVLEKLTPLLARKSPLAAPVKVPLPREYTVRNPGVPRRIA